jgi:hypothetical protein
MMGEQTNPDATTVIITQNCTDVYSLLCLGYSRGCVKTSGDGDSDFIKHLQVKTAYPNIAISPQKF